MKRSYAALLLPFLLAGCAGLSGTSESGKRSIALDSREAWQLILPPEQRCPGDTVRSDDSLAAALHLSVERLMRLKRLRALENEDVCSLPIGKLRRALAKTEINRPDHPGEAIRFRSLQQQDENGVVDPNGLPRAVGQRNMLLQSAAGDQRPSAGISSGEWTALGPGNIGGRVRGLAIHPTDTNKIWAGSVSGGIWTSSDAGASWTAVNDFMPNLAISSIVIDPTNPVVMYAGTGEGFYNGHAVRGLGVFKSIDGGVSWSQLASTDPVANTDWQYVNRIAIHPGNGNILLAATNSGTFRSADGGLSWTKGSSVRTLDVKFDPNNGNNALRGRADGAVSYSTDAGASWFASSVVTSASRIEIAYAKSVANLVYASVDAGNGRVYKSENGGVNWTFVSTPAHLSEQGWYDNAIAVSPVDANHVIIGGLDLYASTDGGANFTKISRWQSSPVSPHADHHAIVMDPGYNGASNRKVYIGNDGGVYRADDITAATSSSSGTGWTNLNNGLAITQFYSGAGYTGGKIIGGTQDNGSLRYAGSGTNWTEYFGGDGGYSAVDTSNSNYAYGEYVYLSIHRSTNGAASALSICDGIGDGYEDSTFGCGGTGRANFIAPFILDPNNNDRMLAGGASLWVSDNVKATAPSWRAIKGETSATPVTNKYISAIAVAPGNADVIWVGHNNGNVYRTSNGTSTTPTWTLVSSALPARFVTRIHIDQDNSGKVYVMFGGYSSGNIHRSTDNGGNWTDISGVLPQAPIRGFARHPANADWLYVGTEVGVFASQDGGGNWATTNDGPAAVSVDELFWLDSATLAAATHGRGMFKISVSTATAPPSCTLSASPDTIVGGGSTYLFATCSPAATSFSWSGSGFGSTTAGGTVTPAATTTYSVTGSNSSGAGNTASATVTVGTAAVTAAQALFVNASTSANKTSVLRIVNTSGTAGTLTATAFDESGNLLGSANAALGGIGANQTLSFSSAGLEHALGFVPASGTAKYAIYFYSGLASFQLINYTQDVATGAKTLSQTLYTDRSSAAGTGSVTRSAWFVSASTSSNKTNVLRLINTSNQSGTLSATLYDENGVQQGSANRSLGSINARQMLGYTSAQLESALAYTPPSPTAKYRVVFTASLPSLELINFTKDIATGNLALVQAQLDDRPSSSASTATRHVLLVNPSISSERNTVLRIVNPTSGNATVTAVAYDEAGSTVGSGALGTVAGNQILALTSAQIETALGYSPAATTAKYRLAVTANVPTFEVIGNTKLPSNGNLYLAQAQTDNRVASAAATTTRNAYVVYPASNGTSTTELRITNTTAGSAALSATAYDDSGTLIASNKAMGTLGASQMLTFTSAQLESLFGYTPAASTAKWRIAFSADLTNFELVNYQKDVASGLLVLAQPQTE